jgi:hypothetical protein
MMKKSSHAVIHTTLAELRRELEARHRQRWHRNDLAKDERNKRRPMMKVRRCTRVKCGWMITP